MAAFIRLRVSGERALWYSRTWSATVTLVGKRGGGMELELAGAKEPELTREIRIGKQLHCLQDAAQTRSRDDMHNRTIVAGDGDKRTILSGADGCCRFPLEVLNAVCILHSKKVYFNRAHVKIAEVTRLAARFKDGIGGAEVSARTKIAHSTSIPE